MACNKLRVFFLSLMLLASSIPALAQLTTPIRWVASLPATCTTTNRARVLVYKYTAPSAVYICSATNTWTQIGTGTVESLSTTYGNSLATAITEIGATPTTLLIDAATTCSAAHIFPTTLNLEFTNDAKITESGTCTLQFQGVGLRNPELPVAVFAGFEAGDITWTGTTATTRPAAVSTELWDTNNISLSDRLDRADKAFSASYQIKIVCYPRTITATTQTRTNREIYFMPGDYLNTHDMPYEPHFRLANDTLFHGTVNARLHEADNSIGGPYSGADAFIGPENGNNEALHEDIYIENLTFYGSPTWVTGAGINSTIITGNTHRGGVRGCVFYRTHAYSVIIGGTGFEGHHAETFHITDNKFIGVGSQVANVINGKRGIIARNIFDQANSAGTSTYAILDLEPNSVNDYVEDVIIEDNLFDCRDVTDGSKYVYAIAAQSAESPGLRNITIRNNTIFSGNIYPTAQLLPMAQAISVGGVIEAYIYGNTIRSTYSGVAMSVQGRYLSIHDNHIIQSGEVNQVGLTRTMLIGSADSEIYDNTLKKTVGGTQFAGIFEHDGFWGVTSSGAIVSTASVGGVDARIHQYVNGLTVQINATDYVITSWQTPYQVTMTASVGTIAQRTFVAGDVTIATDTIALAAHGYNVGARLLMTNSGGAVPAHTLPTPDVNNYRTYYAIIPTAGTVKLAASYANALAGTAIDLTDAGTGTQTLTMLMTSKFSNNKFWGNLAPDGVRLDPLGTSQILSTADDRFLTNVSDTNYTATNNSGIIVYITLTAARTVTLPTAVSIKGKEIVIKDGAGAATAFDIVLDPVVAGETVDGAATVVIDADWGSKKVKSNGVNWITVP